MGKRDLCMFLPDHGAQRSPMVHEDNSIEEQIYYSGIKFVPPCKELSPFFRQSLFIFNF